MKNLPIIIILIIVILIVVISGFMMIKTSSPQETPSTETPINTSVVHREVEYDVTNEDVSYPFITNVGKENYTNEFDTLVLSEDRVIDGTTYRDINSIVQNEPSSYNSYVEYDNGINSEYVVGSIDSLYKEDKPIIPARIFLMDDTKNAFYSFGGSLYYIPVFKCNTEDEERIIYRDYDLSIYRKSGKITAFGKYIDISYDADEQFLSALFDGYYIKNPKLSDSQINIYETNLDNNQETIEIMLTTASNSGFKDESLCNTFLIKNPDGSIDLTIAPKDLGSVIGNYFNTFYKVANYQAPTINNIASEYTIFEYYTYDKGFKLIRRFDDNSELTDLVSKNVYTLKSDTNLYLLGDSKLNDEYSGDFENPNYIKYYISNSIDETENVLKAGTKFRVVNALDNVGHAIIRVEGDSQYNILVGDN